MEVNIAVDRLAIRARPEGQPVLKQNWEQLLFLHWPVDEALLRPHIPASLEIDKYDNSAWIGITPFRVAGMRLPSYRPIPTLHTFNELNVRTYVLHEATPGIWFFSLDASKKLAALGARLFFHLPYYGAKIVYTENAGVFSFEHRRSLNSAARFRAQWRRGTRLPQPTIDSLEFFLTERYCLFAETASKLSTTRVCHRPWVLDQAILHAYQSSILAAQGLPEPGTPPLAHFSRHVSVEIWAPTALES